MGRLIVKKKFAPKQLSIKDFYQKRNQILIMRTCGGIGDILMHRMMLEDIKKIDPEFEIHFACPSKFHDVLKDSKYIDKILDSNNIDPNKYVIVYNPTGRALRQEIKESPNCQTHRSDIWAKHLGLNLTNHDMHLNISEEYIQYGKKKLFDITNGKPCAIVSPVSKMVTKNLNIYQLKVIKEKLEKLNIIPIGIHKGNIKECLDLNMKYIMGVNLLQWMGIVSAADYVISVDTCTFHLAGGLKKPLLGIFSFADGKIYGKYYDFILVQKHKDDGNWDCGPCFNYGGCIKSKEQRKPCIELIDKNMLKNGIEKMLKKWPITKIL